MKTFYSAIKIDNIMFIIKFLIPLNDFFFGVDESKNIKLKIIIPILTLLQLKK